MSDAPPQASFRRPALRIAAIYALAAVAWIALSDYLVDLLFDATALESLVQTGAGLLFVAITSWLLYRLLANDLQRRRRTEQRYRALFESSLDALLVFDLNGRYLDANAAALRMTGYSRDELLERTVVDLAPPDQREATIERLRGLPQRESLGQAYHRPMLRKDGRIIPVESRIAPQMLFGEQVYVSVARDVTEQQQAAEALRQSEARFRTLFEHAPIGITIARGGVNLYANSAYLKLFGYDDPAAVVGQPLTAQVAPERRAEIAERNQRREAGEDAPSSYELTGVRADGSQALCQMHVAQMELPEGRASVAFVADISERKQAEARIQRQSARASALAEISRALAEQNLDHHAILSTTVQRISEIVGDGCAIRLLAADGETLEIATSYHRDPEVRALLATLLVESPLHIDEINKGAVAPTISLLEADAIRARIKPEHRSRFERFGAQHGLTVALRAHGRVIGALTVIRDKTGPGFDDEEQLFIQELADRAALAVDNARLFYASQQEILERRRIETALRDSEATMRAIFDSAHQAIMLLGPDYTLLTFNKYAQLSADSLFGQPMMVGQSILERLPSDDHQRFCESFAQTLQGQSCMFEKEVTTRNGAAWWEFYFTPIILPTGAVNGITFTARNINERKQAEIARRQAEERLRTVVTHAPIVLTALDRRGVIMLAEGAGLESLPLRVDQLIGRSALKLYPDPSSPARLERILAGETSTSIDRIGPIIFETRWTPLRDPHDAIVGAIAVSTDVTEREQAIARLRETEAREQAILHGTTDPIYLKDLAGRYLQVNPASARNMRCTIEEALGKTDMELFPPEEAALFQANDRRVIDSGQQIESEEELELDGQTYSYSTLKAPYRDADGKIQGVIGISRDITEMKRTIKALRASEATNRAMRDAIPDMIFRINRAGYFLDAHAPKRFEQLMRKPLIGRHLGELVPADILEATETCIASTLQSGEMQTSEYLFTVAGRVHEFESRFVASGEDQVVVIARDVTERKRMERALRDARDVYLTLVDEAPMLVLRLDRHGKLDFTNKRWIEFAGYSSENTPDDPSATIHPDDLASALHELRAAWDERRAFSFECRLLRQDGVYRWMDVRSTSFYDDEGRFAGYVGTCSDITDRKRQEQIKDDFLALASHELKTPLASLIGYIHLLERWSAQDGFGERIKQALAAMLSEGVRLNRLINDLLDVSRIQTSKLQMFMQPINLTGLLQDCLAKLQVMLPDYRWLAQIAPEPLLINADAQRIEQALTNLCTNAAKYSAEHAPIMVGLRRAERGVQITVQDHGLGIPAADLPYIFDRFYQVQRPPRESRPGLGLGLFITREIIRQHGGVITVESVEHGGSIFTILLPLEQAPSKRD